MATVTFDKKVWPSIVFFEVSVVDKRNGARVSAMGVPTCDVLKHRVKALLARYDDNYEIQIVFKVHWRDSTEETDKCQKEIEAMLES